MNTRTKTFNQLKPPFISLSPCPLFCCLGCTWQLNKTPYQKIFFVLRYGFSRSVLYIMLSIRVKSERNVNKVSLCKQIIPLSMGAEEPQNERDCHATKCSPSIDNQLERSVYGDQFSKSSFKICTTRKTA